MLGLVARIATPRRILVVGWTLFLVYAFPGFMSYDSVYQLAQARNLEPLNDWHPPVMAVEWSVLDFFVAGPLLMLLLQSGLFLLGTFVLLRRMMSERLAAIASSLLLLAPQTIIVMAVIWKDSQMAGFLIAAIAALLSENRRWRVFGYVCIFLATTMRYNSAAATLPIVMLLWDLRGHRHWLRRYATGFAVWLGLTAAAFGASKLVVEKKAHVFQTGMAPVDLAGTLRFAGPLSDEEIHKLTPGVPWIIKYDLATTIRLRYKALNTFLDVTGEGPSQLFEYPVSEEHLAAFATAWKNVVTQYPIALLRHRIRVFRAQLTSRGGVWHGFTNADWGRDWVVHDHHHSKIQLKWVLWMEKLSTTRLFLVLVYFILSFALLPLCRSRVAFTVLTSGLLYQLGLFAVAPAIDYRYSHWLVACTLLGAVLLFAKRSRVGSDERAAKPVSAALVPDAPDAAADRQDDLRRVDEKDVRSAGADDDAGGKVHRHAGVDAGLKHTD